MKFYIVAWSDAFDVNGWFSHRELRYKVDGEGVFTITSGWVYKDDKDAIVLCQSWQPEQDKDDNSLAGIFVIPAKMVISKIEVPVELALEPQKRPQVVLRPPTLKLVKNG